MSCSKQEVRHLCHAAFVLHIVVQSRSRHASDPSAGPLHADTGIPLIWSCGCAQISSGSTVSAPLELAVVFGARSTLIQSFFPSWRNAPQLRLRSRRRVAAAHFGSCLVALGALSSANEERCDFAVCPFSCFSGQTSVGSCSPPPRAQSAQLL